MITFILGVSATIVVGMFVWFIINNIKSLRRIKQLEAQTSQLWVEIQSRCDSIERTVIEVDQMLNRRIDENFSYTDSRFDKFANTIERDFVSKKNRFENSIDYNN